MYAAITMAAFGLGVAIFPRHCIEASEHRAKLKIHSQAEKKCNNIIYIVTLANVAQPLRVSKVMATFLAMR